jgi:putative transposase
MATGSVDPPFRHQPVRSMDFVMDALDNGRRLKCLTIVYDFTKEAVDIAIDFGISGLAVVRILDQAADANQPND